jgi:hypothetical protein
MKVFAAALIATLTMGIQLTEDETTGDMDFAKEWDGEFDLAAWDGEKPECDDDEGCEKPEKDGDRSGSSDDEESGDEEEKPKGGKKEGKKEKKEKKGEEGEEKSEGESEEEELAQKKT